ncbi:MAG: tripartite tricarboxylate transporter TctB family protein [Saccharospirillum sp.]
MTLERWLSLAFLIFCLLYGYAAFISIDAALPPFAKFSPVWPSSFPKILAVLGMILALGQLTVWHRTNPAGDIDRRNLGQYHWKITAAILALMVAYALLLRTLGFVLATVLFLVISAWVLGERRWLRLLCIAAVSSIAIWYLVDPVLGIFLRPWPLFMNGVG